MSLDLLKESIKVNQVIGRETSVVVIENDIIVPDVKPDIARILVLDGEPSVTGTEILQDKVIVGGSIRYKILYVSDESTNEAKSINTSVNFTGALEIPQAQSGMNARAKCDVEHIDYEILNGRKLNIKTVVAISSKVSQEESYLLTTDIKGIDGIQTLTDTRDISNFINESEDVISVKEALQVPSGKGAIVDILRTDVKIGNKEYKVIDNKIVAKGEINVSTIYISDDEGSTIQQMEHEIPFIQTLSIADVAEDAKCDVEFRIKDYQFDAEEDSDGELRTLNSNVLVEVYSQVSEKRVIDVLDDAYSPFTRVTLEKAPFVMERLVAEARVQTTVKDSLVIEEGNPEISQIFNIISKPIISDYRIADERVQVEGGLNIKLIYLGSGEEPVICCSEQDIPIRCSIEVKGASSEMSCEVDLEVDHLNYSMLSSGEVELRTVLGISAKVLDEDSIPVITKAAEASLEDTRAINAPSITIYYVKPEDTLWSIAKRYYTTISDIRSINEINERGELSEGQQILITRNVNKNS